MNNKIGIITVLYKSESVLEGFVNSLNAQKFKNFEVLFIQNQIDDRFSERYIQENASFDYNYLLNDTNKGVAAANNQGIDFFKTREVEYIHFFNNDVEFEPTFFEAHIGLFNKYDHIDALAPKTFYYSIKDKIWYAGGCISYLKNNCRHYGHNKRDILRGKEIFRVSYAPTCSFMIKRKVLLKSQIRMWENLFVYFDDYVFSKELWRKKVRLFYAPSITLLHKISVSTGGRRSDFTRYYYTRNWAYVARVNKNYGFLLIPFWMLYNYVVGKHLENKAIKDSFKMT